MAWKKGSTFLVVRSALLMSCLLGSPFVQRRFRMRRGFGRRRLTPPVGRLIGVDRNALYVAARLLRLRERDGQNSVLKLRLRLVFLDALQRNLALERPVVAFTEEFGAVAPFGLLLAADRKNAVGDLDLYVFLAETWKLGRNRYCLVGF